MAIEVLMIFSFYMLSLCDARLVEDIIFTGSAWPCMCSLYTSSELKCFISSSF